VLVSIFRSIHNLLPTAVAEERGYGDVPAHPGESQVDGPTGSMIDRYVTGNRGTAKYRSTL
jgi:hypothetical protein